MLSPRIYLFGYSIILRRFDLKSSIKNTFFFFYLYSKIELILKCIFYRIDGDLAETLIGLDVSENRLKPDDIYSLSTSKLEQLYVSANRLTTIPESITDYRCFLALKLLDLSDNLLSCPRTFYVLSTLHNLQVLNLSDNRVSFIPYLVTKQVRLYYYYCVIVISRYIISYYESK